MSPEPSRENSAGRLTMFCDWVSQIPADENNISETSVTMKAGILKRAMK